MRGRWHEVALITLVLGVPPLVHQLATPVPRLDADAVEYFAHLRSLVYDQDLDFANEFEHFGIAQRWDKIVPTPTGHRRTIFSVGPALMWMPFYLGADLLARLAGSPEEGYSAWHIRATALASLAYGVAGLLLLYGLLRRWLDRPSALWTVLLIEYATFLYWYLVYEAVMSHALSFFMAALIVWVWWEGRRELAVGRALLLGLLIGFAATVRWQSGVLLLLPAGTLLPGLRSRPLPTVRYGALVLAAFAVGALPQMLAWKAVFGSYLLVDPPHGRDFLRLGHPFLLNTFFSSRHGLLYWSPILWGGFLGMLIVLRRDPATALRLLVPLLAMSYVNICSGDWWAGGSFSNRRFDSSLPILAVGLQAAVGALRRLVARRPAVVLATGGALLTLWNVLFMEQYRIALPKDETVSFARVAESNAAILAGWVGTPLAWPANWLFAVRHDLPVADYDRMVGKYLFYRQNHLGGEIDLGGERADPALLGEGWSDRQDCQGQICRAVQGQARIFAPLDVPEPLQVVVRAAGRGSLAIEVNRKWVGDLPLKPELADLRLRVPADLWQRELNELRLTLTPGGEAQVDRFVFLKEKRS
jgi:hypothetical protein